MLSFALQQCCCHVVVWKATNLKGGAVNCPKHVMLCCQRHISGHMHQFSSLQQCASSVRCLGLGHCFWICAACCSHLLLFGVLVGGVGNEANHSWCSAILFIIICLQPEVKNDVRLTSQNGPTMLLPGETTMVPKQALCSCLPQCFGSMHTRTYHSNFAEHPESYT